MATSGTPSRVSLSASSTEAGVAPPASALADASWMVGPSMEGSEKGMPISTASAPAATTASARRSQSRSTPAVT